MTLTAAGTGGNTNLAPFFTAINATSLSVSWTSVLYSSYVAHLASDAGFSSILFSTTTLVNSATYSGLSPNTSYYFRVRLATESAGAFVSTATKTAAGGGGIT